ncbi:predicted protein [Naegleria gruberi]|uniref:Predicted protein n=1 Tax=Naegleria gruberi TaxID=5762 RepID=D2VST4_NAEGR|nr:uncharacterized protein NAEGRDRAFT_72053 [Naegleria gruberi]EFC40250.1 predicted protein [Naegleria gruberi]|eukprot:XP_002672994.1 predicted protein [Naegleria gruberi strain NEG-M]
MEQLRKKDSQVKQLPSASLQQTEQDDVDTIPGIHSKLKEFSVSCFLACREKLDHHDAVDDNNNYRYKLSIQPRSNVIVRELLRESPDELQEILGDDVCTITYDNHQQEQYLGRSNNNNTLEKDIEDLIQSINDCEEKEYLQPTQTMIERNSEFKYQTVYAIIKNPEYLYYIQLFDNSINTRNDKEAISNIDRAIRLMPTYCYAYFRKCVFFWSKNDRISIARTIRFAFHHCSNTTMNEFWFHALKGLELYSNYDSQSAIHHFKQCLKCYRVCRESIFVPLVWCGNLYLERGEERVQKSISFYSCGLNHKYEGLFFDSEMAILYNNLGRVQSFNDPSGALKTLTSGANLFPNYVLIHRNRGDVYTHLLRHESALKDFEKCIQLIACTSAKVEIMCECAEIYYVIENWKRALQIYEQTKEINRDASAYFLLSPVRHELFSQYHPYAKEPGIATEVLLAIEYSPTHRDSLVVKLSFLRMETKKLIKFLQHKYFGRIS